jgi:NtrC-family two-component system sensor histidine kinase KinB
MTRPTVDPPGPPPPELAPQTPPPVSAELRDINEKLLISVLREKELADQLLADREAILAQVTDGIIRADAEGRIIYVNAAVQQLWGSAELGVPVERYADAYHVFTLDGRPYPPDDLPLARAVLHGETVERARGRIRRPDGTEVVVEGSATPLLTDDGARRGAVLICRDVTAEVSLEQQKEDFFAAAAHDLRSPLTAIKGTVQLLRRRTRRGAAPDPAQLDADLALIEATSTEMSALIDELMEVARLQPGQPIALHRQPTDLLALCRRAVAALTTPDVARRINVAPPATPLVGNWDAARIDRVVANLLSNAIKYSPDGSAIEVVLAREEHAGAAWAVLTVQDHGIGIPAADLPRIFERFRRGRNVADRVPGTGIGLSGVKRTVEQHGGTIRIASQEGRGTTVTVRLPLGGAGGTEGPLS